MCGSSQPVSAGKEREEGEEEEEGEVERLSPIVLLIQGITPDSFLHTQAVVLLIQGITPDSFLHTQAVLPLSFLFKESHQTHVYTPKQCSHCPSYSRNHTRLISTHPSSAATRTVNSAAYSDIDI